MDAQTRLLQVLIGLSVATVLAVAAAGYFVYREIALLDRKLVVQQRSTQASIERLTTLTSGNSTGIVTLLKAHAGLEQQLARIEAAATAQRTASRATSITDMSPAETANLRALFNLTRNANASPRYKVGDKVAATDLKPLPENAAHAFPQLKESKFLIDRNGALVITAGTDNSVVLVVEPG